MSFHGQAAVHAWGVKPARKDVGVPFRGVKRKGELVARYAIGVEHHLFVESDALAVAEGARPGEVLLAGGAVLHDGAERIFSVTFGTVAVLPDEKPVERHRNGVARLYRRTLRGCVLGRVAEVGELVVLQVLDGARNGHAGIAARVDGILTRDDGLQVARRARRQGLRGRLGIPAERDDLHGRARQDLLVACFEEAAFKAEPGELVGPVRSEFGYHLIRVRGRTSQAVQIADLAFSLEPGQATLTDKQNTLEDVAFYAEESSSFADEAKSRDLAVNQVQAEADQESLPGIGQSRAFSSFMEEAEAGSISEVIEVDDKFVLLKATEVKPEGYRHFEEVKNQIRPQVELEKKKAVQARRMRRALDQSSFQQLPQVLGTELRSESGVTFTTATVPGVGRDPAFSGTVFGLDEGETSGVVEGENAAFVVQVTSMQEPPELTASKRQQIRQQLRKQRQKEVSSQWMAALKEEATIKDQRSRFQ